MAHALLTFGTLPPNLPQPCRHANPSAAAAPDALRSVHPRQHHTPSQRVSRPQHMLPAAAANQAQPPAQDHWRSLSDIVWEGSEEDALQPSAPLSQEHPLWRLMLLSDGSVTRHLQLLTGSTVHVDCLSMAPASEHDEDLPPAVDALIHPLLQREVLLRNPDDSNRALVHATSWWNVEQATQNLQDPSKAIWVSLSQARKELYREIKVVRYGHSQQLAAYFAADGPFWGRQYLFWHDGSPLTLIHEVFSPHLASYLSGNTDTRG